MDANRTVEVLEALRSQIPQREQGFVVLLVLQQRTRHLRDEDLSPVAGSANARRAVNRKTVILVARDRSLARVDPHPHARLLPERPLVRSEWPLGEQPRVRMGIHTRGCSPS